MSSARRGFLGLTPWGEPSGWKPLRAGDALELGEPLGLAAGEESGYGVVALLAKGECDTLATREDFELRLDSKLAEMANSGLLLRAARDGSNPAFRGGVVRILDDFHWEARTTTALKPWHHTGSLYGAIASGEPATMRPLGEWNTDELRFAGAWTSNKVNGKLLHSADTFALTLEQGEPFAKRAQSVYIGLQRHAGDVRGEAFAWFRNVFVRRL